MKKILFAGALALGAAALSPVFAAVVITTLPVTLTIATVCTSVSASAVQFGTFPFGVGQPNLTAEGSISVVCGAGTAYTVTLDAGLGGVSGVRNMRLTGAPSQDIAYNLYSNQARTVLWGGAGGVQNSSAVSGTMGAGGTATHVVYASASYTTGLPAGVYSDTVAVTVTY